MHKRCPASFAAAALSLLGAAPAQAAACLTEPEMEALVIYAMPDAIQSLSESCRAGLPATAPLSQAGGIMSARYRLAADQAWSAARPAIVKLSGSDITSLLGDPALQTLARITVTRAVSGDVKSSDCGSLSRLIDAIQPLPPRNLAMVLVSLMEIDQGRNGRSSMVRLCKSALPASATLPAGR